MATVRQRRKRPRSNWSEEDKALWRSRKDADRGTANLSANAAAHALAENPNLILAFQEYAARVRAHRSLRNALAMFHQRPSAIRVNSAFFWAKEDREVLKAAEPICVIARRRGGKRVEEVENQQTGETEEADLGEWSGFTSERVFDVHDTVPKNRPCQHCGTPRGQRCPASCTVYEPVLGEKPTIGEIAELLDTMLREEGGFDLSLFAALAAEGGEGE